MDQDTNKKIAEWLGWKWNTPPKHRKSNFAAMWDPYWSDETGMAVAPARTFFDDSEYAAVMLLPELVKRGYGVSLIGQEGQYSFDIVGGLMEGGVVQNFTGVDETYSSIPAAISAAVVQLIESI